MKLKEYVLAQLENNRNSFVSGEAISAEMGVTRQAVWKAVQQLSAEGYEIRSVTNRGYMLEWKCDLLSAAVIAERTGAKVYCYDTVASTNDCAAKIYLNEGECIVIADGQTEGRKKDGSAFYSPKVKGIYMSMALPIGKGAAFMKKLRNLTARAAARCIESAAGSPAEIRNIDDIYVNGKKVCGILTECTVNAADGFIRSAVIGIGIYTREENFADSSLGSITSAETRNALISDIYNQIKEGLKS